ncbi:MAG: ferritin [Planctomycetota bacterium]|nr:ferritin [Planctomycetota bacterium]
MKSEMQDAINKQINAELFSSYLYLSMSSYFESKDLPGMAAWMRVQAQEEVSHAMKFFDFVNERRGRVVLDGVGTPKTDWDSPLEAFEDAFKHECGISARIDSLVDIATEHKDHATANFLQWFVAEQVEEEATVDAIVARLRMFGDHSMGLVMLDKELAGRTAAAGAADTGAGE